jgi:hypothetical protein
MIAREEKYVASTTDSKGNTKTTELVEPMFYTDDPDYTPLDDMSDPVIVVTSE